MLKERRELERQLRCDSSVHLAARCPDTDLTQIFCTHPRKASNNGEHDLAPGAPIYRANRS